MTQARVGRQAEFCAALLDPGRGCPDGLRAWNGSDPAARLAVYRNNVLSSLIDALAATFPVVQELVGPEFFRAMAAVFVRAAPPRSPILAHYGEAFAPFIEQFEPARPVPYLADVARLELARVRAHHAADADPVSTEAVNLALASGERMGELRLVCHPSLSTVASPHAVVAVWAAHQGEGALEDVDVNRPESAIVLRQGLDVLVLKAPQGAVEFIAAVQQNHSLGEAAAAAAGAAAGFDLTASLALLFAHGALTSLQLPPRQEP